jgi:hypothetical protein
MPSPPSPRARRRYKTQDAKDASEAKRLDDEMARLHQERQYHQMQVAARAPTLIGQAVSADSSVVRAGVNSLTGAKSLGV